MQDREKKLAIGLGVTLVIAFALPVFQTSFLQPITDAENSLAAVDGRVDKLEDLEDALKRARRNLDNWQYESLPPDPYTAQREYQEWLVDVARMSGFANPVPTLGTIPRSAETYVEVPVTIESKATFGQLARFLYHFERVPLLHRVHTLDVTSPASIGDPLFDVTLVARGLSLTNVPERVRLFPTTTLRENITSDGKTLTIEPVMGFPLVDGFQVKIDEELLTVQKKTDETLTVERGAEETEAVAHPAGSLVELFALPGEQSFEKYAALLANSPFTKPIPPVDYDPKLSPASEQIVTRGEPWKLVMSLSGWDPAGGPAVYELTGDVPNGLAIDPASGELSWEAGKDVEATVYDVTIIARSDILSGQTTSISLPVKLREPNLPPTITAIEPMKAFSGRPVSVAVEADDPDGPNEVLKYAVQGEVPAGVAIDEKSGDLKWVPPLTLELGEYKFDVAVTDSGDPAKTTTQEVSITLEDDAALFTRMSGFFGKGDEASVSFNNLTAGKTQWYSKGDEVNVSEIEGRIVAINPTHILLDVDGQTYKLSLGQNLRQMTPVETQSGSADEPAAE